MAHKVLFLGLSAEELAFFSTRCPDDWETVLLADVCPVLDTYNDTEALSVFVHTRVDAAMLSSLPALRVVVTRSTGFDHIDLAVCKARGIAVYNAPAYGSRSVAEHAFALLFGVARKLPLACERTRRGEFGSAGLCGIELADKTFGVVGTGRIGQQAAQIARGLGMRVLAYDPFPATAFASANAVEYLPLDALLSTSDFVSLHCPASAENRHLLNTQRFAQMKTGAILINTARGDLIDSTALLEALESGKLAGAGLDVIENEDCLHCTPCADDDAALKAGRALAAHARVVLTPHIAFNTFEAVRRLWQTSLDNLVAGFNGVAQNRVV